MRSLLSFPGEYREFIKSVADHLTLTLPKKKLFYDQYYEVELARPNLDTYLQDIYHNKSKIVSELMKLAKHRTEENL